MSTRHLLAAAPFLLFWAGPSASQGVAPEQLMRHIQVLASDDYEGRAPGTAGGEKTEAYVERAFRQAGLRPGAAGGGWRQVLRMTERQRGSSSSAFAAAGGAVAVSGDAVALLGNQPRVRIENAPILFAGYGGPSAVQGTDVKGAVLLMLPGNVPGDPKPLSLRERREALVQAGAQGVILVVSDAAFETAQQQFATRTFAPAAQLSAPMEGVMSQTAATALARAGGVDSTGLLQAAAQPDYRARPTGVTGTFDVTTKVRAVETANIIGRIEGSGRKSESVVLMAHWDHLGLCRPEGAADRICNGAVDNASGTAILIEAARAVAAGTRPKRNVYFVATTSEEVGLLGATAFAESPPPAIGKIVAALNIDTTAMGKAGHPVAIIGRGNYPALERAVDATSRSIGRQVDEDTEANVMIQRQDGWALASRGIPAIMATGSVSDMKVLQAYLAGPYHGPDDEVSIMELGGAVEDTDLHIALARALADPARYPTP